MNGNDERRVSPEGEPEAELVKVGAAPTKERRAETAREENDDALLGENGEGQLTIDVYQTPSEIVVESPIAGVNSDDLDISISSESVTIRGKREHEDKVKDDDYFY